MDNLKNAKLKWEPILDLIGYDYGRRDFRIACSIGGQFHLYKDHKYIGSFKNFQRAENVVILIEQG